MLAFTLICFQIVLTTDLGLSFIIPSPTLVLGLHLVHLKAGAITIISHSKFVASNLTHDKTASTKLCAKIHEVFGSHTYINNLLMICK